MNDRCRMSNSEIVVIAAALLGGIERSIDIEDIAIKVYDLAPTRFSWKKYPDRIDLQVVRYAAKDATVVEEPLLSGGVRDGYMLTPRGVQWYEKNQSWAGEAAEGYRRKSVTESIHIETERLRHTSAFKKYESGKRKEITRRDYEHFTRINAYFPERKKKQRITLIEAATAKDRVLTDLWLYLNTKFIESGGKDAR